LLGFDGYSTDDCTADFGGTSSACPLVAGIVALMLEANPSLTWRDVQEILLTTADVNDFADSDWIKNGAGRYVNHKYGFGRVNAGAAVRAAAVHKKLGDIQQYGSEVVVVNEEFVDNNTQNPIVSSVHVKDSFRVEYVEVVVHINHTAASDLEITLTSPSGTVSVLAELHGLVDFAAVNVTNVAHIDQLMYAVFAQFSSMSAISGNVAVAVEDVMCSNITENPSLCDGLNGNIAMIWRGNCSFLPKVQNAQACGAAGVIVVNNIEEPPFVMAGSGNTIPAVMVSLYDGTVIRHLVENGTTVHVLIDHVSMKIPVDTYAGWKFSTVRNWGEYSDGTWTIKVADTYQGDTGVFHNWQMNIYGATERDTPPTPPTPSSGVAAKWLALGAVLEAVVVAGILIIAFVVYYRRRVAYQLIR
jgi:subtilisin-like proprotein convertase family protein